MDRPSRAPDSGRALPARLDLNLLVVFEALWQERHVARAAERLALSQPATSHALARLRAVTGDRLFERAPGGVRPTPRAEAIWPDAARALAHARSALGGGVDPTRLGRRLRLGMTNNVALILLPRLVRRLALTAPQVDLAILPIDRRRAPEMLARGQVDAVVGLWADELAPGLARLPLYRDHLVLAARRGHPVLHGDLTLAAFAALPQVLVSPSGEPRGPVDRVLSGHGLARRIALVVADYGLAAEAIAAGDLIGVLAEGAVAQVSDRLGIGTRALPFDLDPHAIDLIVPESAQGMSAWLRDLLSTAEGSGAL